MIQTLGFTLTSDFIVHVLLVKCGGESSENVASVPWSLCSRGGDTQMTEWIKKGLVKCAVKATKVADAARH